MLLYFFKCVFWLKRSGWKKTISYAWFSYFFVESVHIIIKFFVKKYISSEYHENNNPVVKFEFFKNESDPAFNTELEEILQLFSLKQKAEETLKKLSAGNN